MYKDEEIKKTFNKVNEIISKFSFDILLIIYISSLSELERRFNERK